MFETILKIIADYLSYILMVIGCEEFLKRCLPKTIPYLNEIMQVLLCLIGSVHYTLKIIPGSPIDFISNLVYTWLLLISTTTLFYDLIIKKVKKESDVKP